MRTVSMKYLKSIYYLVSGRSLIRKIFVMVS